MFALVGWSIETVCTLNILSLKSSRWWHAPVLLHSTRSHFTTSTMETCISDVRDWTVTKNIKLNDDNTEALLCSRRRNHIKVGEASSWHPPSGTWDTLSLQAKLLLLSYSHSLRWRVQCLLYISPVYVLINGARRPSVSYINTLTFNSVLFFIATVAAVCVSRGRGWWEVGADSINLWKNWY